MSEKINLNSIIEQFCYITKDGQEDVHSSIESVKNAMKEACKQTLELAAENADFGICQNDGGCPCIQESHFIDKQSILETINQIE